MANILSKDKQEIVIGALAEGNSIRMQTRPGWRSISRIQRDTIQASIRCLLASELRDSSRGKRRLLRDLISEEERRNTCLAYPPHPRSPIPIPVASISAVCEIVPSESSKITRKSGFI